MKQTLAVAFGVAAIIIGMTYGARSLKASNDHKAWICHVTGNGNAHVIEIDWNAVPAHLRHGDNWDVPQGAHQGDPCDANPVLK